MKHINLEALSLKNILLRDSQFFYDDGYVDDLYTHAERLCTKHGISDRQKIISNDSFGVCLKIVILNSCYVHIFYKNINDSRINLFNRAHEEAHALMNLGRIGYFFLDCLRYGNMPPIIKWMKGDEEAVADAAGAHVLVKEKLL